MNVNQYFILIFPVTLVIKSRGELYKFEYKLRTPWETVQKTKSKYQDSDSIYCGYIQGEPNGIDETIKRLPIVVEKNQRWPWVAALFNQNVYQCTAIMLSRSIAIAAAHCLDQSSSSLPSPTPSSVTLELYNRRSKFG